MTNFNLKIASRRSKLAMVQTLWVKDQLERKIPNLEVSIEAMATQGDKILDVALAKIGDKGLFTKELEAQMLVGHADIAVHSLKDLPTNLPIGLKLGCITKREDPADALVVSKKNECYKLETLPEGSIVGTSSLRRLAQLRNKYLEFICKNVFVKINNKRNTYFKNIDNEVLELHIAHNEGNYFCSSDELKNIQDNNQIAAKYCDIKGVSNDKNNPNGALLNIAGIFNKKKNILGMMPHPERMIDKYLSGEDGSLFFKNLINNLK